MSRSGRLLDLLQTLRGYRRPVSGKILAEAMGVSLRTLYRDIATLQAQGATIEGEAGVGYVLRPGFMLPPLMFSEDEIEALVLGSRWVARRSDTGLATAADSALAKIAAVLPPDIRDALEASTLLVGPSPDSPPEEHDLSPFRQAIRQEHRCALQYRDKDDSASERFIWPFALGFFERARVLVAWCELRQDYRHFRLDRIATFTLTDTRYPRRRQSLLKGWKEREGIAPLP